MHSLRAPDHVLACEIALEKIWIAGLISLVMVFSDDGRS